MNVLIVINRSKPEAVGALGELRLDLEGRGTPFTVYDPVSDPVPAAIDQATHVIALGGDGTILTAVRLIGPREIPLLGVQFGRLGFLAGCHPKDLIPATEALLTGEIRIERRATLSAWAHGDSRRDNLFALNEVAITRGVSGRIIAYEIEIAGVPVARMRGDGILVATATGSTGYALSAGGPLVAPGFDGLVVVPIAPHTLHARAIMTNPTDEVVIRLVELKRGEGDLFLDGELAGVTELKEVGIRRGATNMLLARYGDAIAMPANNAALNTAATSSRDFYTSISQVFFGGANA